MPVAWMCYLGSWILGRGALSISWLISALSSVFSVSLTGTLGSLHGHNGGRKVSSRL